MLSTGPSFDLQTALTLARASQVAYGEMPNEFLDVRPLGTSDCGRCTLLTAGGQDVLAFRGTKNLRDLLTDGNAWLDSIDNYPGLVHRGFAHAVHDLWKWFGWRFGQRGVWITGHSMGGAMATLASVRLKAAGVNVAGVYTFGCPRVGDSEFSQAYGAAQFRVIDAIDFVPHLPAAFAYRHVGTAVTVNAGTVQVGTTWLQSFSNFLTRMTAEGLLKEAGEAWQDHGIGKYIEQLEAAEAAELARAA